MGVTVTVELSFLMYIERVITGVLYVNEGESQTLPVNSYC